MKWTRDGDQWVATGEMGEYRITEMKSVLSGSNFIVACRRARGGRQPEAVGEFSLLSSAKAAALKNEGYYPL